MIKYDLFSRTCGRGAVATEKEKVPGAEIERGDICGEGLSYGLV